MNKKHRSLFFILLVLLMLLLSPCLGIYAEFMWDIQVVDEVSGIGASGCCPIVVDADGNPHITHIEGNVFAPYIRRNLIYAIASVVELTPPSFSTSSDST